MAADLDVLDDLARKAGLDEFHIRALLHGAEQEKADLRWWAVRELASKHLPMDIATALRLVSKDHEVRPEEAWACVHTDLAAANLFAYLNQYCHGRPILGRTRVDGGEVVVLDLRPVLSGLHSP